MSDEITVEELKEKMDRKDDFVLLDVREDEEFVKANIQGAILVPLSQLPQKVEELRQYGDKEFCVHCKSGGRSAQAIQMLKAAGFTNSLKNVEGGILAWSERIDPSVPQY
jgi:sulfur-carrier protein adenylyltransferase/sulfurtransferase